jgi:pantothenate kinase
MLGIAGPPGSGKSARVGALVELLGPCAALVAMDGFHIADAVLGAAGLRERKGAPDTFDATGFVVMLERLRIGGETVYAPRFERSIEDSIAAAIAVPPSTELIVTEGNYLLHWPQARAVLDEVWYLDPPQALRHERLIARHVAFGRTPSEARGFALGSDERNAELIHAGLGRADLVLRDA